MALLRQRYATFISAGLSNIRLQVLKLGKYNLRGTTTHD